MKIIVIGGSGTIGKEVVHQLSERHKVITVSRSHSQFSCDIEDSSSLRAMFEKIGAFDAVVVAAGEVHIEPLSKMTEEKYKKGLFSKLMGQVNVVLEGQHHLNLNGSFTLTSGILTQDPVLEFSSASMVNSAIEGFVKAAAIEMSPKRINCVSPGLVEATEKKIGKYFRGFPTVSAKKVALAYVKSVEGAQTGQIYTVKE